MNNQSGGSESKETSEVIIHQNLRHNILVNLIDGGFYGFGIGFASFVTVIPLFVSTLTNSAILIGLIPAIHNVGWQIPQLFVAPRVSRQSVYKSLALVYTIHERVPFLGLALVAWLIPHITNELALALIFLLLIWQGLGGGFAASPWQSMIGKIIPAEMRGTFLGAQSSAANLLASLSALLAGLILQRMIAPNNYSLTFLLAFACMVISWFFLNLTREPAHIADQNQQPATFWHEIGKIMHQDRNFRRFLIVRMLSQLAIMGTAFYTVYAVRFLGMSVFQVGVLTSILLGTQIVANPIMGWLGDHWSHRSVMALGIFSSVISSLLAWWASVPAWFYLVFILTGFANVAIWTISLAMIQEFGTLTQRPAYIGMSNTLIAPFTILAPFMGGWIADFYGYQTTFIVSAAFGLLTTLILQFLVRDPRQKVKKPEFTPAQGAY